MKTNGFTLIELSIVVAIVGILASIAVPQFRNATNRANVSKAYFDFHTLRAAIEQYRLDRNAYPSARVYAGKRVYNFKERFTALTTPIAYLSEVPLDPFPKRSPFEFDNTEDLRRTTPGADAYGYFRSDYSGPFGIYFFGYDKWMLGSSGPDGVVQYLGYFPQNEAQVQQLCSLCSIDMPTVQLLAIVYNPTNGTISPGELIRWSHQ